MVTPLSKETIYSEELDAHDTCFKISAKAKFRMKGYEKTIFFIIKNKLHAKHLSYFTVYFTSEKNSYGVVLNQWMDGKVMPIDIQKSTFKRVALKQEKYSFLKMKGCREESFYECFTSEISKANFNQCSKKCLPISLPSYEKFNIPMCETIEERNCAMEVMENLYDTIVQSENSKCLLKSCSIDNYSGDVSYTRRHTYDNNTIIPENGFTLSYEFSVPEKVTVYNEYLIYDNKRVIGSVGGTLGMFIGFSFSNFLSFFLKSISDLWKKPKTKDSKRRLSTTSTQVIIQNDFNEDHKENNIKIEFDKNRKSDWKSIDSLVEFKLSKMEENHQLIISSIERRIADLEKNIDTKSSMEIS